MSPTAKEDSSSSTSRKKKVTTTSSSVTPKSTLYEDLAVAEEKEALSRTASGDAKLFSATLTEMKKILKKIKDLKKDASKNSAEITDLRIKVSLLFLTLKKLNRYDKLRLRKSRDLTFQAKQSVDSYYLQLQNLKYEVMHLQKEVTKCIEFKSGDQDLDLISIPDFYSQAPDEITENTSEDEHVQRKARLQWEMMTRKKLAEEEKSKEEIRDKVENSIRAKSDKLNDLKPQLAKILQETKPVQTFLEMPLDEDRNQYNSAKALPRPLFVLYSQASAYSRACDPDGIEIVVNGDLEEAKIINSKLSNPESDNNEEPEADDDEQVKKKRRRNNIAEKSPDKSMLDVHPLSVSVTVKRKDSPESIQLDFTYVIALKIVAVKNKLNSVKEGNSVLLSSSGILNHLIRSDLGTESPNPSTVYKLKKPGLPDWFVQDRGNPYIWAQTISGLDFLSDDSDEAKEEICRLQIETIIKTIRSRLFSRLALQKQISQFEKAKLISCSNYIPDKFAHEFPSRISCRIRSLGPVEFEQYDSLDVTHHLTEKLVDKNDFIYRLQIDRDPNAKLIALIAIKPDYPKTFPIFCLNLHWNGEYNIHNNEPLRELEREVNTSFMSTLKTPEDRCHILSLQIQRLMACFDVMLEAWSALDTSQCDFPREKTFIQPVRGRNRAFPLSYQHKLQIFSQRLENTDE